MKALSTQARSVRASTTMAIDTQFKKMRAEGINVIGFSVGEPDFPTPEHIKQAGIRAGERLTSYEPSPAGFDGLRNSFDRVADGLTKILTRHSNYADFQLTRTSGTQYTDKDGTGGGPVKIRTIVGMYFSAARSEAYEKHGNRIEFSVKDTAGKKRKVSLTPIRTTFTEYVW